MSRRFSLLVASLFSIFVGVPVPSALTKPGGALIYCTCSLEPEEGEAIVNSLLAEDASLERATIAADEVYGRGEFLTPQGDLRTFPCHLPDADSRRAGLDGFYAARLRKR